MVEVPAVNIEEEDDNNIDGGNVDNFHAIPLPLGF